MAVTIGGGLETSIGCFEMAALRRRALRTQQTASMIMTAAKTVMVITPPMMAPGAALSEELEVLDETDDEEDEELEVVVGVVGVGATHPSQLEGEKVVSHLFSRQHLVPHYELYVQASPLSISPAP